MAPTFEVAQPIALSIELHVAQMADNAFLLELETGYDPLVWLGGLVQTELAQGGERTLARLTLVSLLLAGRRLGSTLLTLLLDALDVLRLAQREEGGLLDRLVRWRSRRTRSHWDGGKGQCPKEWLG